MRPIRTLLWEVAPFHGSLTHCISQIPISAQQMSVLATLQQHWSPAGRLPWSDKGPLGFRTPVLGGTCSVNRGGVAEKLLTWTHRWQELSSSSLSLCLCVYVLGIVKGGGTEGTINICCQPSAGVRSSLTGWSPAALFLLQCCSPYVTTATKLGGCVGAGAQPPSFKYKYWCVT